MEDKPIIERIWFEDISDHNKTFPAYYFDDEKEKLLANLSKVNFFVGANNVGKSLLLRELFTRLVGVDLNFDKISEFKERYMRFKKTPKSDIEKCLTPLTQIETLIQNEQAIKKFNLLKKNIENTIGLNSQNDYLFEKEVFTLYSIIKKEFSSIEKLEFGKEKAPQKFREYSESILDLFRQIFPSNFVDNLAFTFIPTLRTIKKFVQARVEEKDSEFSELGAGKKIEYMNVFPLKDKVVQEYFADTGSTAFSGLNYREYPSAEYVFTGEELYEKIQKLKTSGFDEEQKLIIFQNFLSIKFFDSKPVYLSAPSNYATKEVHLKIGNDSELPLSRIGDGLQAIILMAFPLFEKSDKKHLIFIEEPELYLHPGLQRIFLEGVLSIPNVQAFMVTHSNHFLDLSAENADAVSVYTFRKKDVRTDNKLFHVSHIGNAPSQVLDLLGVRNSSVFLANCTIWVEGISDKMYLRKYLELYCKHKKNNEEEITEFKEDLHYAFVEYSGDNISHFTFEDDGELDKDGQPKTKANSISNRIFLIADKDIGKKEKHKKLQEVLDDNYYPLKCLEIENLLSPSILKKTLEKYKNNESKNKFQSFRYNAYKNKPIGEFILPIMKKHNLNKLVSKSSETATAKIKDKRTFAKRAIESMEKWQDLSTEAKQLTKKIYEFIKKHNG